MIAALYVEAGGVYYGLPDVDPWDVERDARLYDGPHPVVAHPPCARWCRLAGLVEARWGHKRGEDGGCFAAARYGHPAKKATWLYAYGTDLPSLKWGAIPDQESKALVSWCGNHVSSGETRPRVGKAAAARSPLPFRDLLLDMARSAHMEAA